MQTIAPDVAHVAGPSRGRILAVDDDQAILSMLARVLGSEGFVVDGVTSAARAVARLRAERPDVILLDLGLADGDGLELLADLRRTDDVPVILVTARGAEPDRVRGLRTGADDYVVKPFSYPELAARIDNVLRRAGAKTVPAVLTFGPLTIDTTGREVHVDDRLVVTTAKEFDLLAYLASVAAPGVHARGPPAERLVVVVGVAGPVDGDRARASPPVEDRGRARSTAVDRHRARRRVPLRSLIVSEPT